MPESFIVYFIKRVHTLCRMSKDIEHIVANRSGLTRTTIIELIPEKDRATAVPAFFRGIPIAWFYDDLPDSEPLFIVKRADTGKHENWLEDYELDPEPDLQLLVILNQIRRNRSRAERTTRVEHTLPSHTE